MGPVNRSIKLNMLLNALNGALGLLLPLITFPYVTRVLGVMNIGKINFTCSVISFFVLFAGLGINSYAVREGARIRDNKLLLKKFSDQMFSITVCSALLVYLIFLISIVYIPKFSSYSDLFLIFSIQILLVIFSLEWIYVIYEDYLFATIRNIVIQTLFVIALLLFVRNQTDIYVYALISAFTVVLTNLSNFIYVRKYCKVSLTISLDIKKHIKPILVMFGMVLAVTIYVSSDMIILGFLWSDYEVGIYSVSVKIYTIVKVLLSSLIVVTIPRLSSFIGKNEKLKFSNLASETFNILLTLTVPVITGILLLKDEIIVLLCGQQYIESSSSLCFLSFSLFFCLGAWFWGQCILIPHKREALVFKITCMTAILNIILNFIFIPIWKEDAAAITTLLAEAVAFVLCWHSSRDLLQIKGIYLLLGKIIVGCIGIVLIYHVSSAFFDSCIEHIIFTVLGSTVIYSAIECALMNESVYLIFKEILKQIKILQKTGPVP